MTVTTLHDLFVHDLEDIYYAENELLDALEQLAENTDHEAATDAFREHREETQGHVERLDQVFELLDREPAIEECEGIEGLLEEHETFVAEEEPSQAVLDVHNIVAAQKTEHYEIVAYENLVRLADQLDMDEASDMLADTLEEERNALDKLVGFAEDMDLEQAMEPAAE